MRKALIYTALFIGIISLSAFDYAKLNSISATYSFFKSNTESPLIQLILKENNTFEFIDQSNPSKIIDAKGKYELNGNRVKLFDYNSKYKIANVWKIDSKYPCIKSRKGLKFTRICNCKAE